jgi:hypothetical protein
LEFTVKDADGVVIDLTNIDTLYLNVQKASESALKFSGAMSVDDAVAGECSYTVIEGDFDEAGDYWAEIEATFNDGKVITFPDLLISVAKDLPR